MRESRLKAARFRSNKRAATTLTAALVASLAVAMPSAAAETPVPGTRWEGFLPNAGPAAGATLGAALAPDGSALLITDTNGTQGFGIAKVDVPTGVGRADFGRSGYTELSEIVPSGQPVDVAPRPDGGAYLLLGDARRLRLWRGFEEPRTVGVVSIAADGTPDEGFGALGGYGNIGTRYWSAGQDSAITHVGGIAAVPDDKAVFAWTEQHPGQVTETNPSPKPQTDVILRRVGADGELDPSYGDGGTARWVFPAQLLPGGNAVVEVQDIQATASGAVLALVETQAWTTGDVTTRNRLHIVRFTPEGDLDPTFGDGGAVEVAESLPDCSSQAHAGVRTPLSIGPDGAFVVASARPRFGNGRCDGGADYDAPTELLVNVYNADGSPDTEFSSDGRLRYHLAQPDPNNPGGDLRVSNQPEAVLLDRLGRVVVQDRGNSQDGALIRFDHRGALDTSFGAAAGSFSAPPGYDGGDLLETDTGDYLIPGSAYEPFVYRFAAASLYLADTDVPTSPAAPSTTPEGRPTFTPRTDRALRPGDTVRVDLGTWDGPAIDHFEVSLLGCEPRHSSGQRCFDQPLGRTQVSGTAEEATFTLPVGAAGQYLSADVVAVTADGVRGTTAAYGGQAGPSRHLIELEATAGLPGIVDNSVPRSDVYTMPDGTSGVVFSTGYGWKLRVAERAPGGKLETVLTDDTLTSVSPLQVTTAADGWVHALLESRGNLYAIDRDPITKKWSAPVQLSDVAVDGTDVNTAAHPMAVAAGGRAVVTWAEQSKRAGADDSAAPVAVRVRTPQGWSPVRYIDEPAAYSCPDGSKSCFHDPNASGDMWAAARPVPSITDSGVVNVLWTRKVVIGGNLGLSEGAFSVRLSADGTPGGVQLLSPWRGRRVEPLMMTALADGSSLVLVKNLTEDQQGFDLVMQRVVAGGAVRPSDGSTFPGQILRSYRYTDTLWTSMYGDPRFNQQMVMGVDGTHWRLFFTEETNRPGPGYREVVHLSGTGTDVNPVQVLDRRPKTDWGGGELNLGVGASGRALLITDSAVGDDLRPEYSFADANGPMSTLEPLATEYPGENVLLDGAPATTSGPVANRNYSLTYVDRAWKLTSLGRDNGFTSYRLANGAAGPRVAIDDSTTPRPNAEYTVKVDPIRTFDPDGGQLTFAWDLDQDGTFDDATGPSATVTAGPAGSEKLVSVRATAPDGDSAEATSSIWPQENEPPQLWEIVGPGEVDAGAPVVYTVDGWDDGGEDLLSYVWFVNGQPQAGQTGRTATLTLPAGQVTLKVRATDGEGASSVLERAVTATSPPDGNKPPTVALSAPTRTTAGNPATFTATATDDAGADGLSFSWRVDGVLQPTATTDRATLTLRQGQHDISVKVTDLEGETATASRTVKVTIAGRKLPAEPVEVQSATKKAVTVNVTVPGKGFVAVVLRKPGGSKVYAKQSAKTTGPSAPKLVLPLTKLGARLLSKPGSYPVDVVTTFTPARKKAQVRTQRLTVTR